MALIEQPYRHWKGVHQGIWSRRLVIAQTTLMSWLAVPWIKRTVFSCWMGALGMVVLLFIFSQFVDSKSALAEWMGQENPSMLLIIGMLETWLKQYPELVAGVPWSLLFGFFALALFWPTMFALTMCMPQVISRDLGTRAIVIYQAKAVSKWDYLLGKAGALVALMTLTWLGPLVVVWVGGNLLAPSWTFFWHTREALLSTLLYVGGSILFLTVLSLGISSVSIKAKAVTATWICVWLLGWGMEGFGWEDPQNQSVGWLRHLSFRYNLAQVHSHAFDPAKNLHRLRDLKGPDGRQPLSDALQFFSRAQDIEGHQMERDVRNRIVIPRLKDKQHEERPRSAPEPDEEAASQKRQQEEQAIQAEVNAAVSQMRARRWSGARLGLVLMAGLAAGIVHFRFRKA